MGIEAGSSTYYQAKRGIVQDGLVLHLDAGVKESYGGAGNTWYDLSGNNANTSPSWSSVYLSNYGGIINYPTQSNALTTLTASQLGVGDTNFTASVFLFKKSNPPLHNLQGMLGFDKMKIWNTTYFYVAFKRNDNTYYNVAWDDTTESALRDQWIELCYSWGNGQLKLYRNGGIKKTLNINSTISDTFQSIQSDAFRIGAGMGYYNFYGHVASARLYNRVLPGNEVQQNFNATRHRFGI
jgi:hypothetical protein